MFEIEDFVPGNIRLGYNGVKQEIIGTMDRLEVGQSFVVPKHMYSAVSVRARVSEQNGKTTKHFRSHAEVDGTRVIRQS